MGFVHCLVFQKAQSNAAFWELCVFPISGKRRWGEVPVEFGPLERATDSP